MSKILEKAYDTFHDKADGLIGHSIPLYTGISTNQIDNAKKIITTSNTNRTTACHELHDELEKHLRVLSHYLKSCSEKNGFTK